MMSALSEIATLKLDENTDAISLSSDWSDLEVEVCVSSDEDVASNTEKSTDDPKKSEDVPKKGEEAKSNQQKDKEIKESEASEEKQKEDDDTVKCLQKQLSKLQKKFDKLSIKCEDLESQNENLKKKLHKKEQTLIDYQIQIERLSKENPILFSDYRISTDHMKMGNYSRALDSALENIVNRGREKFYIGASSAPDQRMAAHAKNGYQRMQILFCTGSFQEAESFETELLDRCYNYTGCTNIKRKSCGLKQTKRVFYIYMLM